MTADVSLALMQSIVDSQKDLIVIFHNGEPVLINKAFKKFFSTSSLEQYKTDFGAFVDNFVPHPSYFHAQKIEAGDNWFDSILKLPEIDRVVSMITPEYEPHAFSVSIDRSVEEYSIVAFTDITQFLIKRIMIENHANMDVRSGAYAKKYFLQIAQSYQDAAIFNEKIFGAILIKAKKEKDTSLSNDENLSGTLVEHFKSITRQDDMLIRWDDNAFLLIYLVDNADNAQMMLEKLQVLAKKEHIQGVEYTFTLKTQQENESIKAFIKRVET
jgi:hypothetical protein